ncbi:uncharacterized protein PV07_03905 [Cladophialophora immunda]|uniref:Uncharacterized protein n=1 Tax=Cladophialophora immunda TaxID=569365 RepID=A0A0D2B441_9EURO|nr:uncharacterized protein PV07_03905 [Cladophialophora immunda]KIW32352.1 hypothetical protein PV07_03905 [Cladophialophora immunda]OQV07866.1 hypothetical protein CLAIMM_12226 [Cladophialophora immunda]
MSSIAINQEQQSESNGSQGASFLSLPLEIRDHIYALLFDGLVVSPVVEASDDNEIPPYSLSSTSEPAIPISSLLLPYDAVESSVNEISSHSQWPTSEPAIPIWSLLQPYDAAEPSVNGISPHNQSSTSEPAIPIWSLLQPPDARESSVSEISSHSQPPAEADSSADTKSSVKVENDPIPLLDALSIFLVCRQVYAEAQGTFFRFATFSLETYGQHELFTQERMLPNLQRVQRLRISFGLLDEWTTDELDERTPTLAEFEIRDITARLGHRDLAGLDELYQQSLPGPNFRPPSRLAEHWLKYCAMIVLGCVRMPHHLIPEHMDEIGERGTLILCFQPRCVFDLPPEDHLPMFSLAEHSFGDLVYSHSKGQTTFVRYAVHEEPSVCVAGGL